MASALHPRIVDEPSLGLDNSELARDYDRISATRQFEAGKRLVSDLAIGQASACSMSAAAPACSPSISPTWSGRRVACWASIRCRCASDWRSPSRGANLAFQVGDAYDLDDLPDSQLRRGRAERGVPLAAREDRRRCSASRALLRRAGASASAPALKGHVWPVNKVVRQVLREPPFADYPRRREGITLRVDAEEMRALFETTGFVPSLIEVRPTEQTHHSAEGAIRFSEASSFGNAFGHLPEELKPLAREAVRRRLEAMIPPEGLVQQGSRLVAIAERW